MQPDDIFVTIHFPSLDRMEEIQNHLYALEPSGLLEQDDGWECYFLKSAWLGETGREFRRLLAEEFPDERFDVREIPVENWNEAWEETITPIRVSDRITITPSWHTIVPGPGEIVMVIDPKMSFGTGYHATTRLMLRLLEKGVRDGMDVFDVGTGTGVLAIAAVKLGAARALGIDIDEWSIPNADENIRRNGVGDRVRIANTPARDVDETFDLVLSNITKNDNIDLLPAYARLLRDDGFMILSGFHAADIDEIARTAAALGYALSDSLTEDEWAACTVRR